MESTIHTKGSSKIGPNLITVGDSGTTHWQKCLKVHKKPQNLWERGEEIAQVPQEIVRQQQQQQQKHEIATVATMWQMDGNKCFEWFVAPNNQKQFKTLAPKRNEGTTTKRQQLWVAKKKEK